MRTRCDKRCVPVCCNSGMRQKRNADKEMISERLFICSAMPIPEKRSAQKCFLGIF